MPLSRTDVVLAGLAAAGQHSSLSPVQVQKLFFLVDREAAALVDGPHFAFKPYDYGPFDKTVYETLGALSQSHFVAVNQGQWYRTYSLTEAGYAKGREILDQLSRAAQDYLHSVAAWVANLGFQQLVAAIYARYPDMRANSIFRE